ncbi:MAG: 30S ribosomal protein S6 [Candidatus Marinimicrobia bacterium]|nr:30S ribosomal protein S6 [Candidatus Neomarinimicrobiota bacterium]MCF7922280.1 30S ribosomal protein S6 [Candidatus Neomarinimicrobiota bacterium]
MKKYECLYIVNINFDSEGISAVVGRVEEVLKNVGGELVNTQHWGKRKLAYAIDKERYGNYVLMHFQGENPDISELAREFEIESGILHYMTIRLDEFPDFETLSVPQTVDAERGRRPGSRDSRDSGDGQKPRRYVEDEDEEDEVIDDIDEIEDVVQDDIEVAEVAETPVNAPEEVAEVVAVEETSAEEAPEEIAEATKAEAPESADADSEESAEKAPEEEAEKPADAE